jgi:hypothetical protein
MRQLLSEVETFRRGSLLSTAIFVYAATSPINGYCGGSLYARMGGKVSDMMIYSCAGNCIVATPGVDTPNAAVCLHAASHGLWYSLPHQLHCHLLSCFARYSLWYHGKLPVLYQLLVILTSCCRLQSHASVSL